MATALMMGNGSKNQKNQEKRGTNVAGNDDEERGPKRRLVRSATDKSQRSIDDESDAKTKEPQDTSAASITVDIKAKEDETPEALPEERKETNKETEGNEENKEEKQETVDEANEVKFGSTKEKECWEMYCKMADKGLKVSYDTILRGMLTPTEYRMRRRESITPVTEETTANRQ